MLSMTNPAPRTIKVSKDLILSQSDGVDEGIVRREDHSDKPCVLLLKGGRNDADRAETNATTTLPSTGLSIFSSSDCLKILSGGVKGSREPHIFIGVEKENEESSLVEMMPLPGVAWKTHTKNEYSRPVDWFSKAYLIPLSLSLISLTLTAAGSWHCSYFKGANISFTGGLYGLWTLEDSNEECQPWDLLFFTYKLGAPLIAARAASMTAMLLGLALTATLAQASQFHFISWGVGWVLLFLYMYALSWKPIYTVWCMFWFLTYILLVVIVRSLFLHPQPRRIHTRGLKIIAGCFLACAMCCLSTLVSLKSEFCTCTGLTAERLDGRDPGENCSGECTLQTAGYCMILSSAFSMAAAGAVLTNGIQTEKMRYPDGLVFSPINSYQTIGNHSSTSTNFETNCSESNPVKGGQIGDDSVDSESVTAEEDDDDRKHLYDDISSYRCANESVSKRQRTACQMICSDFRNNARTCRENMMFWTFRTVLVCGYVVYALMILMLAGSWIENTRAARKPETKPYFTSPQVCAFNLKNPKEKFKSFADRDAAIAANWTVAHCGECGKCSNPHDIMTYVETRKTVATKSKSCTRTRYLGSYEDLSDCLQEKIGFTRECTYCWADNMINTGNKCLFTCMRTLFSGLMKSNNIAGAGKKGWMNQCLYCDEKMSGPTFVTCSGVNRRRLGIPSEIERDPSEQCKNVDIRWDTVNFTSIGFEPE